MSLAIPSIAGPSRLSAQLYRHSATLLPALSQSCTLGTTGTPSRRSGLLGSSYAYSTSPARLQSRRQAYTLAQPINTPSGFEGVPAPAYVNPVDPSAVAASTNASASGKGKEKVQITEGHGAPPPAPAEVKPRRKIQAKKAAITMVRSLQVERRTWITETDVIDTNSRRAAASPHVYSQPSIAPDRCQNARVRRHGVSPRLRVPAGRQI